MNNMCFIDPKSGRVYRFKATQSKEWGLPTSPANIKRYAADRGWVKATGKNLRRYAVGPL